MVGNEPVEDLERLRRRAATLQSTAEKAAHAYNRATWVRFFLVFFPVPFIVVLFRLYLDAWTYYVTGGFILVSALVLFELDTAARDRCNAAERAAAAARQEYQAALQAGGAKVPS